MKNIRCFLFIKFIILLFLVYYPLSLFAQQRDKDGIPRRIYIAGCDNINEMDSMNQETIRDLPLLDEYFYCRAGYKDDVNECDNIFSLDLRGECRKIFNNFQGFIGRLVMSKQINSSILDACVSKSGGQNFNLEECKEIANAILKKDISICEEYNTKDNIRGYNQCRAILGGKTALCQGDKYCMDLTIYFKAVSNKNRIVCNRINSNAIRWMCIGYLSKNEKTCEKNKGFLKFYQKYCR